MIEAALAAQLAGLLASFLPKLLDTAAVAGKKAVESVAGKAGEAAWSKAVSVWNILRPEVEKDPEVAKAIQDVAKNAEDPYAKVALSWQLKKLTIPPEALAELQKIVAESKSDVRIITADRGGVAVGGSVSGGTIITGYHEAPVRAPPKPMTCTRDSKRRQLYPYEWPAGSSARIQRTIARETRIVNTGFAPESKANKKLKGTTLQPDRSYYFWLDVGKLSHDTIETKPTPLPEDLPIGTRLVVALFPFKDEIRIKPGSDIGELMLKSDGSAQVIGKNPAEPANISPSQLKRRLFFPVSTPDRTGTFRLRCSIYHNQMLVQSRLIRARVTDEPESIALALQSDVDYALTDTLQPAHLARLAPHRLSLMLNSNGDGTHTFSLFGSDKKEFFKKECTINASKLKTLTENARAVLREVSWGSPEPYKDGLQYMYQQHTLEQLEKDLIKLAVRGWNLYADIFKDLTGMKRNELIMLMLEPKGPVQIALKHSPSQVLPAALFYDYPLDANNPDKPLKLCDAFISSLEGKIPLDKTPCFQGKCPRYEELDYVCPSGFWGFRHILGLPVSLDKGTVTTEIPFNKELEIVVGGEYKSLQKTGQHLANLRAIGGNLDLHAPPTRNKILEELENTKAQLIYFYCHGGYVAATKTSFLQVDEGVISGSDLLAHDISWEDPLHPLVFINGCHTAALDPEQAYNLVEFFVGSGCAGVIGTEITIFEQLACDFAEECLRRFLAGNASIGEAIRGTRLELLRKGNPLGLVYTPFVTDELHLIQKSASSEGVKPVPSI